MKNIAILCALLLGMSWAYATPKLPDQSDEKHLGVSSCASSTCHGSVKPLNKTRVLQNEYVIWSRYDPHSRAMETLRNAESQKIAKNLGLKEPAHESAMCTGCHLSSPKEDARGPKFTVNDGIGCESCHGGSEKWLKPHTQKDRSHEDNIADGMYPTADPQARTTLCLSCHMGNDDKFTTHEIMGAGHPRLSFELQTFSELQPMHYRIDDDYIARKNGHNALNTWMGGIYGNAINWLELLASDWMNPSTLFPELAVFDCQACHHAMGDKRWQPRNSRRLPPGTVRLADSHLMMAWLVTAEIAPAEQADLRQWLHQLHAASTQSVSEIKKTAKAGIIRLKLLQKNQANANPNPEQLRKLLAAVISAGERGWFDDYNAAEQAAFGIQLILRAVKPNTYQTLSVPLFNSVNDEDNFEPYTFKLALKGLSKEL
ncbi:MAG: multiheme c-type cytochrome [Gammaproteobacteria bacterium]|nr:multiheme c-type cytochrome [Gammaproteobacteria bacterium]